jgi:hypothetical protein
LAYNDDLKMENGVGIIFFDTLKMRYRCHNWITLALNECILIRKHSDDYATLNEAVLDG